MIHSPPKTNLFSMKTICTGSHRTTEEHCTFISLNLSKFYTSTYFNRFALNLVYVLHISSLVNCLSFIKIRQAIWPYQQFKVSKSNNI